MYTTDEMDSIDTILGAKKRSNEPPEMRIIRDFIHKEFQETCRVSVSQRSIAIMVDNGAIANMVQMRLHEIREACATEKKLYVRIGTIS